MLEWVQVYKVQVWLWKEKRKKKNVIIVLSSQKRDKASCQQSCKRSDRHHDGSWIPNVFLLSITVHYTGQQTMPCTLQLVHYVYSTERFGIQPFAWLSAVPSTVLTGRWENPALRPHRGDELLWPSAATSEFIHSRWLFLYTVLTVQFLTDDFSIVWYRSGAFARKY